MKRGEPTRTRYGDDLRSCPGTLTEGRPARPGHSTRRRYEETYKGQQSRSTLMDEEQSSTWSTRRETSSFGLRETPTSPGDDPRRYRSGDNSAQRSGGDQPLPVHPHGEGGQSVKHTFIITEIIQICQFVSYCFKTYTRLRQHKRSVRSQCRICRT
jgi:hypothetical protein